METTQQDVFGKVQEVMVDALGVDLDEVSPTATLVQDLGAESIDFLDIVFRLEKTFGLKIDQNELFPDNVLTDPKYVVDGRVTDFGMDQLRQQLPHTNLESLDRSRQVEDFSQVFTVESIVKFVQAKIG